VFFISTSSSQGLVFIARPENIRDRTGILRFKRDVSLLKKRKLIDTDFFWFFRDLDDLVFFGQWIQGFPTNQLQTKNSLHISLAPAHLSPIIGLMKILCKP
jgi:hypothetical protein